MFTIGVAYETEREKLRRIPGNHRGGDSCAREDPLRAQPLHDVWPFGADFESVYQVLDADYMLYADIQQDVNFRIHEEFERLGIRFAYPTQRLFLEGPGPPHRHKPALRLTRSRGDLPALYLASALSASCTFGRAAMPE